MDYFQKQPSGIALLVAGLLAASLGACQSPSGLTSPPKVAASAAISASASPTPSASATLAQTVSTSTVSQVIQGRVMLPSGVRQESAGVLLPSGILLPSGVLLTSGATAEKSQLLLPSGVQSESDTADYSNISFKITAYNASTDQVVAETESNSSGAYVLSEVPVDTALRIEAAAKALPDMTLQAFVTPPAQVVEAPLNRNINTETTAAVLLAKEAQANADLKTLPQTNLQNTRGFSQPVQQVARQLEQQLGRKPITRLSDLSSDPKIFLEQLKELLKNNPQLREPARDSFHDSNLLGKDFDPRKWPFPTQYFKPTQGKKQPTLPDGSCPPPPPGPGGERFTAPPPDADGYCPVPQANQPDAPGGLVIIPEEGGVPIIVPGTMGTPVPATSAQPEKRPDLAKAAAILGISEQVLREALGAPPPNLQTAAQKLGITHEKLKMALDASMAA